MAKIIVIIHCMAILKIPIKWLGVLEFFDFAAPFSIQFQVTSLHLSSASNIPPVAIICITQSGSTKYCRVFHPMFQQLYQIIVAFQEPHICHLQSNLQHL
jgi:hypothetical protein